MGVFYFIKRKITKKYSKPVRPIKTCKIEICLAYPNLKHTGLVLYPNPNTLNLYFTHLAKPACLHMIYTHFG